jgi:membrane protease YdiL (CAAX protease family)
MDDRTARDLPIFVAGFFVLWTIWIIVAWKLDFVPELARPLLRTAIWIAAAFIWVRWQKTKAPLNWLGLKPVSAGIVALSAAAFLGLLAWNGVRVAVAGSTPGHVGQLGGIALFSGLVGVFVEELVFRGVVQTKLSEIMGSWLAILLAAALFLMIHVPGWLLLDLPVNFQIAGSVFIIGAICGALRQWSKSIWPGVAAHWANNIGALF